MGISGDGDGSSSSISVTEAPAPIPFVMLSDDSTFEIAPEAVEYLQQIKGNIAVVSIAGLYRTGKSYLLNLLLGRDRAEAMFSVGATVNACTKGIWIWGQPVAQSALSTQEKATLFPHLQKDTTIVFMDTEGLGSTQRSQTQDTRIFALGVLLSSLFIYNSRGVIDSSAIEDLSLVVHLTKFIQAKAHAAQDGDEAADGSALATYFPDFLWVVRDFTLQLQAEGRKVTPRDYLENALKPQPPMTEEVVQKNQIRSLLSTFFPARDCVTMVRPLNDENLLRNLINQPYESLRPEFREQLDVLKKKVNAALKPKKMMSKILNGPMLVSLAQNYVVAFNSGSSPVIATVWDRVIEAQCDQALEDAMSAFNRHMDMFFAEKTKSVILNQTMCAHPVEEPELTAAYEQARLLAEEEFARADIDSSFSTEVHALKLSEYMLHKLKEANTKNDELSSTYNKALLQALSLQATEAMAAERSDETLTRGDDDDGSSALQTRLIAYRTHLDDVVAKYHDQSSGTCKHGVLCNFLREKLLDGMVEWTTSVKSTFRSKETQLENQIGSSKQALGSIESKVRAAQEILQHQNDSYERTLQNMKDQLLEERASLEDEIQSKQAEIGRAQLQSERMASLHAEVIERLEAQLVEAKEERKKLEGETKQVEAKRQLARQTTNLQVLESERKFHKEEKALLENRQQLFQKVIELEHQLGEQETAQMAEIFGLEKESKHQVSQLKQQNQDEQEDLKSQAMQELKSLEEEQEAELLALHDELEEKHAQLSALQEQLAVKQAKANSFFGGRDDCALM